MICKICNQNTKDSSFANYHLRKIHGIIGKEYYDTFFRKEGEGICQNDGCGKETTFKGINEGYAGYCSKACTSRSSKSKEKSRATMLRNYGVENAFQSKEIQAKIRAKNLREKGVEYVSQLQSVKDKIKQTNLKNLGVEYPMQNKKVLQKATKTNLEKYGCERPSQNEEIQTKIKDTNIKKYGVASTLQDEVTIEKIKLTRKANYWNNFLVLLCAKKIEYMMDKDYFLNNLTGFKYKCLRCNREFVVDNSNADRIFCTCMKYRSKYEDEIIEELKKYYCGEIKPNKLFIDSDNKRFEIDVFIPEFNIGIDFGGMFWHSHINKEKNYHQEKYLFFKKMGIKLIQVFENEWKNNKDVVLSIIKNHLVGNEKIYARNCDIREMPNKEYQLFLINNHLQKYASAPIRIGLYYNNELMSLVSFRNSRYNTEDKNKYTNDYQYELTRSCTKIGYTVVGGFARLLNYFEVNFKPRNIVSYIDVRYFNGNSYEKNGFILKHLTKPNYHYFHKNEQLVLYNRMAFQKSKLKDKLETYDPNLTEYENMLINGYYKIYDAGVLTLIKDLSQ